MTVKSKNKNAKNKKFVSKVKSGKTAKITFTKNAKKGKYTFTVTAPKNGQYKAVKKTILIKVK